ncbi:MAG: YjjG family noncanonical pyrimidine nucleotidase [Bacillota bacterium]|nr:YjjG family noncanonical pyrimidine nucleotidase [Bacillota bacterium]
MKYKHLFFDLDNTLWDFAKNSHETFSEIYRDNLTDEKKIPSLQAFFEAYTVHNTRLWSLYRKNMISKEELRDTRFLITLKDFGIDDEQLAEKLSEEYTYKSPRKGSLFPGTIETLEQLKGRFHLHILTNGFEEIQHVKLAYSGLEKYFESLITSEQAGSKKPDAGIFYYALEHTEARVEESLMIGDDLDVDIIGAKAIGMDTVLFDPFDSNLTSLAPTHRINRIYDILPYMERIN